MSFESDLQSLRQCYQDSPYPSFKVTSYFPAYTELFAKFRNTKCTFIETGVLDGGSLFMWRSWLGPEARIIGLDLNPGAQKWQNEGFEIYIGDQGDPRFWRETFAAIGEFDVLLDDGGHQSFQQIVTLTEAMKATRQKSLVVIEDTCCSMMREFNDFHRDAHFLAYAKDSTDLLTARMTNIFPKQWPIFRNREQLDLFRLVNSIQFYPGIVAYRLDANYIEQPQLIWNRENKQPSKDFRYVGVVSAAVVSWPDPFASKQVVVRGAREA